MAENSKIEWTDHTFNPWEGCQKVSPGCDHCYAEARNARFGGGVAVNWGPGAQRRRTSVTNWRKPLQWNAAHAEFFAKYGRRQRVFCASLADVFDNAVPDEWRADLLHLIADTPNLDWLLLTKRIGNAHQMLDEALAVLSHGLTRWEDAPWPNVWIGATMTSRAEMLRDGPKLKAVHAAITFWSVEPMLGDFGEIPRDLMPEWVIVGGESGPHSRPMHPAWPRNLRDQCASAGVPFLFKQWGEWLPGQNEVHPDANGRRIAHHQDGSWGASDIKPNASNYVAWDTSGRISRGSLIDAPPDFTIHAWAERVGKKAAGRLLDGAEWDQFPDAKQSTEPA